jgi:hypothetical protein
MVDNSAEKRESVGEDEVDEVEAYCILGVTQDE